MRLLRFAVRGFQSYETTQTLRVSQDGPTLLAGRNNVGKSALLRAMRFPTQPEPGATGELCLEYEWEVTTAELQDPRSGLAAIGQDLIPRIPDGTQVAMLKTRIGPQGVAISTGTSSIPSPIGLGAGGGTEFEQLQLVAADTTLIDLAVRSRREESPASRYLWWRDDEPSTPERYSTAASLVNLTQTALQRHYFIAPRRSTERAQSMTTTTLTSDGANLTVVLGTLFRNSRHELHRQLEEFITDVFPEIRYIEVPTSGGPPPTEEIELSSRRRAGLRVPLKYSGTGIEQALMLAAAVLTAPSPGYLFLIDEPHAFLHPWAERRVLRFIRAHPEHQYVIATHSPAFLTAYPVDHARLVVMSESGTEISDTGERTAILKELGFTAADLWSADAILWVEGSSDYAIAKAVAETMFPTETFAIRQMPDPLRAAGRRKTDAKAVHDLCGAIAKAVLPTHVRMTYLYDDDERSREIMTQVEEVTEQHARFLQAREIENCLLSRVSIHADLTNQCDLLGLPPPSLDEVSETLDALISATGDPELYPAGQGKGGEARVVGSVVLKRLYWRWATSEYDKVRDGERLARIVAEREPAMLEPLIAVLRDLITSTPTT